jgi:hypothetical protein
MTRRITGNLDLVTDGIGLNSHLSKTHGNRVELAKALANIFLRFEVIELIIEKFHGFIGLTSVE